MEQRQFDAWGNLAVLHDSGGHNLSLQEGLKFFDRGYASHEHLQEVHLINMNGRLYDPVLMTFLMPDNFVQAPDNTQSYNRYAYVWNNPLKYTDPSGEVLLEIGIAVGIAVAAYLVTNYVTDQNITLGGVLKTAVIATITAVATFGIGTATESIGSFFLRSTVQAVAHGVVQGGFSSLTGGSFWSGFAAGALSSIAASAWTGGTNVDADGKSIAGTGWGGAGKYANSGPGMIAFGTVTGGASAELTGGNFWMGAASGFMVSGLGHLATRMNSIQEMQSGDKYSNNGEFFGSQGELEGYINQNVGDVGTIEKSLNTNINLATADNLPSGYSLVDNDIIGPNGRAGGITVPNGFKSSKIFIAPSLKGDYFGKVGAAKMGIVHEMLHGYHLYKGLANYNRYSEFAASTYTYSYLKAYGSPIGASYYLSNVQSVPRSFSWRNLPSIINTGLK